MLSNMCETIAVQSKCMCNNAQPRQKSRFWYYYNIRGKLSNLYCNLASNAKAYEDKPKRRSTSILEIPWFQSWNFLHWKYWTRWASSLMELYDHTGLLYWLTIPKKKHLQTFKHILFTDDMVISLGLKYIFVVVAGSGLAEAFRRIYIAICHPMGNTFWFHEWIWSFSVRLYEDFDTNSGYRWHVFLLKYCTMGRYY